MPELRKDPLTDRWVIIATERTKNPTDLLPSDFLHNGHDSLAIDPLAAGNERMTPPEILAVRPKGGPANTAGWKVRVIPNTYPVLRVEGELRPEGFGLYDKMTGIGAHEIIVETPDTDQGLETLPLEDIAEVFRTFKVRMQDLEKDQRFRYFLIFKNVGRVAGSPLRHAHSQLIATPVIPRVVETKLATSRKYYEAKERCVFEDILQQELKDNQRVIYQNPGFVAFCPYASRFPFEIAIYPRRQVADFHQIEKPEMLQLADCYKVVVQKLNKALNQPSYNYLFYTAPTRSATARDSELVQRSFRWHLEIFPRLSMINGFEVGSGFYVNPVPPEEAARYLEEVQL